MRLYHRLCEGVFLNRPNRFVAICEIDGRPERCHVKNTGRLRELLLPGSRVWLEEAEAADSARKTRYDLVCVEADGQPVNLDSQAPNRIFAEWAERGGFRADLTALRSEVTHGDSRFDFGIQYGDRRGFV